MDGRTVDAGGSAGTGVGLASPAVERAVNDRLRRAGWRPSEEVDGRTA